MPYDGVFEIWSKSRKHLLQVLNKKNYSTESNEVTATKNVFAQNKCQFKPKDGNLLLILIAFFESSLVFEPIESRSRFLGGSRLFFEAE